MPDEPAAAEFRVEDHPDPAGIDVLETQIRREASAAMGLGDEAELAIFVRDAGRVVAGISGWTWGDCCELQSLWVEPSLRGRGLATRLIAAAEAEAAARGCSQTVHFTYAFQARALYERNGYELVGRVEDFPSGTDVLWYRKRLNPPKSPPSRQRPPSAIWWAVTAASALCRASVLALPACEVPIQGVAALPRQARHRHHYDRGRDYRRQGAFIPDQVPPPLLFPPSPPVSVADTFISPSSRWGRLR